MAGGHGAVPPPDLDELTLLITRWLAPYLGPVSQVVGIAVGGMAAGFVFHENAETLWHTKRELAAIASRRELAEAIKLAELGLHRSGPDRHISLNAPGRAAPVGPGAHAPGVTDTARAEPTTAPPHVPQGAFKLWRAKIDLLEGAYLERLADGLGAAIAVGAAVGMIAMVAAQIPGLAALASFGVGLATAGMSVYGVLALGRLVIRRERLNADRSLLYAAHEQAQKPGRAPDEAKRTQRAIDVLIARTDSAERWDNAIGLGASLLVCGVMLPSTLGFLSLTCGSVFMGVTTALRTARLGSGLPVVPKVRDHKDSKPAWWAACGLDAYLGTKRQTLEDAAARHLQAEALRVARPAPWAKARSLVTGAKRLAGAVSEQDASIRQFVERTIVDHEEREAQRWHGHLEVLNAKASRSLHAAEHVYGRAQSRWARRRQDDLHVLATARTERDNADGQYVAKPTIDAACALARHEVAWLRDVMASHGPACEVAWLRQMGGDRDVIARLRHHIVGEPGLLGAASLHNLSEQIDDEAEYVGELADGLRQRLNTCLNALEELAHGAAEAGAYDTFRAALFRQTREVLWSVVTQTLSAGAGDAHNVGMARLRRAN